MTAAKRPHDELPADPRHRENVIKKLARETVPAPSDEALVATFLRDSAELVATSQGRKVNTEIIENGFFLGLPALGLGFHITVKRVK